MLGKRLGANNRDSLIGREIVLVILQHDEVARFELSISGIPSDDIHLPVEKSAVEQAQIHNSGRRSELQAVGFHQTLITILSFHKLIAEPGPPIARIRNGS